MTHRERGGSEEEDNASMEPGSEEPGDCVDFERGVVQRHVASMEPGSEEPGD